MVTTRRQNKVVEDEDVLALTGLEEGADVAEEEFHTEESEAEEDLEDEEAVEHVGLQDDSDDDLENNDPEADASKSTSKTPLLPAHILQPMPSPLPSDQAADAINLSDLTRKEKRAIRTSSRRSKKRIWDKIRRDAAGSGVVEAGKAAQLKRGIVTKPAKNRVRSGRASKPQTNRPVSAKTSGRQALIGKRIQDIRAKDTVTGTAKSKARKG